MRKFSLLLSTIIVLALALTACGGQQTSTSVPSTNVPPVTVESTSTTAATEAPSTTGTAGVPVTGAESPSRVSKLMNFQVMDQSGNKVGTASDLVIDLDNSRVAYVLATTSADLGSKMVLIPWSSLQLQSQAGGQQSAFVLLADPNFLQKAPITDITSILPQMCQAAGNWDADIRSFWQSGAVPGTPSSNGTATSSSGTGTSTGTETATSAPVVASTATRSSGTGTLTGTATPTTSSSTGAATAAPTKSRGTGTGQGNAAGQGAQIQGVVLASQVIGSSINIGPGIGNGQGTGNGTGNGNATAMPNGTATSTTGTGTGTGTGNTGLGNMTATMQDLIIDVATGDVRYAVVSTADNAQNWIPVPLALFRCDTANNALMTIASANALQTAPFFTEDQFPDTSTTGWDQQWMDFWQSNGGTGTGTGTGAGTATPTASSGTSTGTETATATP